jgi:hypothetical protein
VYERCHKHRTYFHLAHAAPALFDRVLEFGHSAYEPTVRERLLIQTRLGGIVSSQLNVDGQRAEVFYVGGKVRFKLPRVARLTALTCCVVLSLLLRLSAL